MTDWCNVTVETLQKMWYTTIFLLGICAGNGGLRLCGSCTLNELG